MYGTSESSHKAIAAKNMHYRKLYACNIGTRYQRVPAIDAITHFVNPHIINTYLHLTFWTFLLIKKLLHFL